MVGDHMGIPRTVVFVFCCQVFLHYTFVGAGTREVVLCRAIEQVNGKALRQ
jgi:hypothetical protein